MAGFEAVRDFEMEDESLEQVLRDALGEVDPNPAFVGRLSTRFKRPPAVIIEHRTLWGAYVIMALGLFAGTLLLWLLQALFGNRQS